MIFPLFDSRSEITTVGIVLLVILSIVLSGCARKKVDKEGETQALPRPRQESNEEPDIGREQIQEDFRDLRARQLFTQALAYESLSNYSRALELYRKVVKEVPENTDSLASRAQIRTARIYKNNLDNPDAAIKEYQTYVDQYHEASDRQEVLLELARLYRGQNRMDSATRTYKTFVQQYESSPYREETLYNLGNLYMERKSYEEAISTFRKLSNEFPGGERTEDALLKLAIAYESTNRKRNKLSIYEQFLSQFPDSNKHEKILYRAIKTASELGQNKAIQKWTEKYRSMYPNGEFLSKVRKLSSGVR